MHYNLKLMNYILEMFKKNKTHFTSKMTLTIVIVSVLAYTSAAFLLQFNGKVEISPTLTSCFFAFFTVEIFNLTSIKKSKIKNNYTSPSNPEQTKPCDNEFDNGDNE